MRSEHAKLQKNNCEKLGFVHWHFVFKASKDFAILCYQDFPIKMAILALLLCLSDVKMEHKNDSESERLRLYKKLKRQLKQYEKDRSQPFPNKEAKYAEFRYLQKAREERRAREGSTQGRIVLCESSRASAMPPNPLNTDPSTTNNDIGCVRAPPNSSTCLTGLGMASVRRLNRMHKVQS